MKNSVTQDWGWTTAKNRAMQVSMPTTLMYKIMYMQDKIL